MSYLIGTAIIGAILFIVALRMIQQWRLAREGIVTRGRVRRKLQPFGKALGPIAGVIRYNFLTPRGQYVEHSVLVGEAICHLHEEGSEIEVVYLKDNPTICSIKHAVNVSRQVMNLPPL